MSSPKAAATGTLGSTPLLNLLVYALDRRLTGTFVFEYAGAKSALSVRDGSPFKVKIEGAVATLGDVLVSRGLSSEARDRALETALESKRLLGAALLEAGVIDPEELCEGLGEQICRKAEWLAKLPPDTFYGFYSQQDFLARYGGSEPPAVDPLAVIWRVAKGAAPARIEAVLSRLGGRPLKMHRYARAGRFGFDAAERSVVDVLRVKAHTLEELNGAGVLSEEHLERVVFVLAITRHLDVGGDGQLPVGVRAPSRISGEPPRPTNAPGPVAAGNANAKPSVTPARAAAIPSAPPAPARRAAQESATAARQPTGEPEEDAPEVSAFKEEIRQRAEIIGSLTYYEILGVDRRAPTPTISAAFFDLAKRWHPDRLGPRYADVRELASRVFSRMTEAHQVLSNEEQRQEYERLMKEGGATDEEQEKVQRILRAATAFQKAEVLARRGNYAEAEKEACKAYEGDPEQAEYMALYADILSVKPGRENYEDVVKIVNKARQLQPDNVRVHVYRARVLGRAGDRNGALREYQWIAERDPNNVEAAREVRLHKMRAGERQSKRPAPPEGSKGGLLNQDIGELFGKFFKR